MGKRYLILIRHAQQDRTRSQPDPKLSPLGHRQAEDAAQYLRQRCAQASSLRIESSPKQRCRDTIGQLGKMIRTAVNIEPLLDEASRNETFHEFHSRIESYLEKWKEDTADITVACTHSDWIPEAVRSIFNIDFEVRHASFIEISIDPSSVPPFEISNRRQSEVS